LSTMGGHVDKLGRSLTNAVGDYNKTVSSLESRVLVTARRFRELGAVADEAVLPELQGIEQAPRGPQSPELMPPPTPEGLGLVQPAAGP